MNCDCSQLFVERFFCQSRKKSYWILSCQDEVTKYKETIAFSSTYTRDCDLKKLNGESRIRVDIACAAPFESLRFKESQCEIVNCSEFVIQLNVWSRLRVDIGEIFNLKFESTLEWNANR